MTSLFSVSYTLASLTVCVVFLTVGGPGAVQGNVHIRECSACGWMELLESETIRTVIQCDGFEANDTVEWRIVTNNSIQATSTCGPYTTDHHEVCNSTTDDIFVVRYDDKLSGMSVLHNLRKLFWNARVDCYRQDYTDVSTCTANVVTDAHLSDCKFTMTADWTLAGTCNFRNAYSSNGTYNCTWTLTPSDGRIQKDINIPGIINRTEQTIDGKLHYTGTCSFTRQLPAGNYSYKVLLFPSNYWSQPHGTVTVTDPPTTTQLSYTLALPSSTENPISTEVPAKIIEHLSSEDLIVRENDEVTLTCNVTGVPMPEVTWFRPEASQNWWEKRSEFCQVTDQVGVNGEVLIIHNITRYCGDTYECVAFNGVPPPVSHKIHVSVEFAPEIYLPNRRIGHAIGKDTILECFVAAFPPAVITWTRNGKKISTPSQKYRLEIYEDDLNTITLALRIFSIELHDFSRYTCVASNPLGEDSESMILYEYSAHLKTTTRSPPRRTTTQVPLLPTTVSIFPPKTGRGDKPRSGNSYRPVTRFPDSWPPQQSGQDQPSSNNAYITGGVITAVMLIVAAGVVVFFRKSLWRRLHDRLHQRQPPGEIPYTGLDVYETVGQPSHTTSRDRDTVQYEILDQTPVSFVSTQLPLHTLDFFQK